MTMTVNDHEPGVLYPRKKPCSRSRAPMSKRCLIFLLLIGSLEVNGSQPCNLIQEGLAFTAKSPSGTATQTYTIHDVDRKSAGQCNDLTFGATGKDGQEYFVKFPSATPFGPEIPRSPADDKILQGGDSPDSFIQREISNMRGLTAEWRKSDQKNEYKPDIPLLVDDKFKIRVSDQDHDFTDIILMTKVRGELIVNVLGRRQGDGVEILKTNRRSIRNELDRSIKWFADRGFMDVDWLPNTLFDTTSKEVARIDFGLTMQYDGKNWNEVCEYIKVIYQTIKSPWTRPYDISLDPKTPTSKRADAMEYVMRASWSNQMDYALEQPLVKQEMRNRGIRKYDIVAQTLADLNKKPSSDSKTGLWIGIGVFVGVVLIGVVIYLSCRSTQNPTDDPEVEGDADLEDPHAFKNLEGHVDSTAVNYGKHNDGHNVGEVAAWIQSDNQRFQATPRGL